MLLNGVTLLATLAATALLCQLATGAPPPDMPDPGPFCEGDGWTPVDPSDLPEQLLRLTMEHGWGYLGELYGVYGRWRNCSHFSELQLAAEGCRNVRVAVGSGGLRQCYLLSPCSVEVGERRDQPHNKTLAYASTALRRCPHLPSTCCLSAGLNLVAVHE